LRKFSKEYSDLKETYRKNRDEYTYFIFTRYLKWSFKCINWHKKMNPKPIRFHEVVLLIISLKVFKYFFRTYNEFLNTKS
ncbi:MAG: hypothetical protein ACOCUV_03285, partial [bacterium]